jgi:hypothetical protein
MGYVKCYISSVADIVGRFFCDIVYSIYLILYGLFNSHITSSACLVDNELERTWKEAYVVVSDTVT